MTVKNGETCLMKTPKNLSEKETFDTINYIISKIAPKYTFSGYDLDDIKQESFIICIEALDRYDNERPLENFLAVNLSNRLKNLIRDNHMNSKSPEKKNIKCPASIKDENYIEDRRTDFENDLINKDIKQCIDEKMPHSMCEDYLKMLHGVYVPKNKKEQILEFIRGFVE